MIASTFFLFPFSHFLVFGRVYIVNKGEENVVQQNSLARKPFNCIHQNQNNSLIFQFIIAEYINGSEQVESITSLQPDTHRGSMETLQASLEALSGSLQEYMRFISWNLEEGILSKLKCYASLFAANSEFLHSKRLQLEKNASQAWKASLEALDILRLIHEQKQDLSLYENLYHRLNYLTAMFKKLGKLLAELILEFAMDENVLFFILRHKEKLDGIYGEGFVKKMFIKMYPDGINEAEKFVKRKYAKRGFDNLLMIIASKFTELAISRESHDLSERTL